jgi:AcrR family transcriptional regulator
MARISKDPEERRQELVQTAYELFKEKGYEQVNVSDIVGKVGVAQGTFYYYFKTKLDVLNAVIDLYMRQYRVEIGEIADDAKLTPMEKVQAAISSAMRTEESEKSFINLLNSNENFLTHKKFMAEMRKSVPLMTKIVEEGVADGTFEVLQPRETVELMLYMWGCINDSLKISKDDDERCRKIQAAEDIITKVLGIKGGRVKLAP